MKKKTLLNLFLLIVLCLLIALIVNFFITKYKLENFASETTTTTNFTTTTTLSAIEQRLKKNKQTFDEWQKDQNKQITNLYDKTKSTEKGLPTGIKKTDLDRKSYPYKFMVKPYKKVERPEKCPKCKNDCSKCVPDCSKCMGAYKSQYYTYKSKSEDDKKKKIKLDDSKEGYKMWF